MRSAVRALLVASMVGASGAGCTKPVNFALADADSRTPLEGVRIYRHSVSIFSPIPTRRAPIETDFAGTAVVHVPSNPTNLTFLRQGYEPTAVGVIRDVPAALASHSGATSAPDPDAAWQRVLCWDDLMPKVPVDLVMRPLTSADVEVLVIDEHGAPIPDCEVLSATFLYLPMPGVEPEWGFPTLERAVTDRSGRATIRAWSGFRNRVTARAPGRDAAFIDVRGAEPASVELRLPTLAWKTQRVKVVSDKGRPIDGVSVSFGEIRNGIPDGPNAFIVATDRDGLTPVVRLPNAESLVLRFSAKGWKDRMAAPLWRAIDDGGTYRVIMERD